MNIFKITVQKRKPNYIDLWKVNDVQTAIGTGFVVQMPGDSQKVIITAYHVVDHAVMVTARADGKPPIACTVIAIAPHLDLAVLYSEDLSSYEPCKFDDPEENARNEAITTYGYPKGGNEYAITEGKISRRSVNIVQNRLLQPVVRLDIGCDKGNSGSPVVMNRTGMVIGMLYSRNRKEQNAKFMIPASLIVHALHDIDIDAFKIKKHSDARVIECDDIGCDVEEIPEGLEVTKLLGATIFHKRLQVGDIITKITDKKATLYNFINVTRHSQFAEMVSITLQSGKELFLPMIKRPRDDVPSLPEWIRTDYFIFGGMDFSEINRPYINEKIEDRVDLIAIVRKTNSRVIMKKVFPNDVIEHRYTRYKDLILRFVSGREVFTLEDLIRACQTHERGIDIIFEFHDGRKIQMDYNSAKHLSNNITLNYTGRDNPYSY